MRYQAIVFDVGDTLVQHQPDNAQIYSDRLRHLVFSVEGEMPSVVSKAIHRAGGEQTRKEQAGAPRLNDRDFNHLLDAAALDCLEPTPLNKEALLDQLEQIPLPTQTMAVIDGVFPVLDELKRRGYRLAIVSNHHAFLLDYLRQEGLAPYFDPIIISDLVGVEKPDPRIMHLALEGLRLPTNQCLYVGDHPLDVLCAKEAGMDVAWIAPAAAGRTLPGGFSHCPCAGVAGAAVHRGGTNRF